MTRALFILCFVFAACAASVFNNARLAGRMTGQPALIGVATPASDSPANYADNMKLWVKADAGLTMGSGGTAGLLVTWADQSGQGNHLTHAAGGGELVVTNAYGFGNTVSFGGGSGNYFNVPSLALGAGNLPWTMIFAGRMRVGSEDSSVLAQSGVNQQALRLALAANNSIGVYNGVVAEKSFGGALSNGCRVVVLRSIVLSGDGLLLRNNSASNAASQAGVLAVNANKVGAYPDFAIGAAVDMSELIIWTNRVLTEIELNSLYTNYFVPKYSFAP